MSVEGTPNPDVQANPVSELTGSEDEAAAAFAQRDTQGDEPNTDEPEPADDAAEDADTEADKADPDAEPEADELVEVEIDGKTYEVPVAVQKNVLRQADYSRRMNEVGALEKSFQAKLETIEALTESAEKRGEALAAVRLIDMQLQHLDGVFRKARAEGNPEAPMMAADLIDLRDKRKDAVQNAANVASELTKGNNQLLASERDDMDAALKKTLKGWGNDLGVKLTNYAQESGVRLKTLQSLTDPAVVVALDKAQKWDALQANKTAIKGKAQPAPQVVKPGSPRKSDPQADAMAQLRKDNSTESAEAAFLSRMR